MYSVMIRIRKNGKNNKEAGSTKVQHNKYVCCILIICFLFLGWLHPSRNQTLAKFITKATGKQTLIANMELLVYNLTGYDMTNAEVVGTAVEDEASTYVIPRVHNTYREESVQLAIYHIVGKFGRK